MYVIKSKKIRVRRIYRPSKQGRFIISDHLGSPVTHMSQFSNVLGPSVYSSLLFFLVYVSRVRDRGTLWSVLIWFYPAFHNPHATLCTFLPLPGYMYVYIYTKSSLFPRISIIFIGPRNRSNLVRRTMDRRTFTKFLIGLF